MSKLKDAIEKFALANAYGHDGKAQPGAIVGKLIAAGAISDSSERDASSLKSISKKDIGKTMPKIKKIVKKVNKLSEAEQKKKLEKVYPEFFEEREEEEKTLPEVKGKVVTRFEPAPSGPMHIGHAYTLASNYMLARENGGRLIIRVSDTNPENTVKEAYKLLKEDAKWLTDGFVKTRDFKIQSDRMKIYYKYAKKALRIGAAYVCTCDSEDWHKLMLKKKACPCRDLPAKKHLARWKKMLKSWPEGKAVVRVKTDLKHKNPAMRDWPALRINTQRHPRQGKKYRVWPLMNFAVAIDDHEMGITHAFRAKEHRDNEKRQKYLYDAFGWKMAKHWYLGAINFTDMKLSTTAVREAIEAGKYEGWDDVRLPFIRALKRRGYQAAALIRYGLQASSETDKTVRSDEFFKMINKFNREIIDADADRYFFVADPVKIKLDKKVGTVSVKKHPAKKAKRKIEVGKVIYIDEADFKKLKTGRIVCIKDMFAMKINKSKKTGKVEKVKDYTKHPIVQGVSKPSCSVAILMPNNKQINGIGEPLISKVKKGEIVQFERFGFVRCEGRNRFVFLHK